MTTEKLNKIDACRHLLPEPGAEVVGELIAEIRRLRALAAAVEALEFEGILCSDVNGKNWFDERESLLT